MDLLKSQVILPVSPKGAGSIPAGPRDGTTARPVGRLAANRQCHRPRFLKNKEDLKSLRCYATFRLVVTFWRRLSGSLPSHKNRPQWFRIRPLGRHERDRGRAGRYGKVVGSVAVGIRGQCPRKSFNWLAIDRLEIHPSSRIRLPPALSPLPRLHG